jgi:hypothetical protein
MPGFEIQKCVHKNDEQPFWQQTAAGVLRGEKVNKSVGTQRGRKRVSEDIRRRRQKRQSFNEVVPSNYGNFVGINDGIRYVANLVVALAIGRNFF